MFNASYLSIRPDFVSFCRVFQRLNFILSFEEIFHQIFGVPALFENSDKVANYIEFLRVLLKLLLLEFRFFFKFQRFLNVVSRLKQLVFGHKVRLFELFADGWAKGTISIYFRNQAIVQTQWISLLHRIHGFLNGSFTGLQMR